MERDVTCAMVGCPKVVTEAQVSGVENPYRYSTKEWDEKSGLYYFGARYYSPEIGRWTQRDPAGTVDGLNLYGYGHGDPLGSVDPWGLRAGAWECTWYGWKVSKRMGTYAGPPGCPGPNTFAVYAKYMNWAFGGQARVSSRFIVASPGIREGRAYAATMIPFVTERRVMFPDKMCVETCLRWWHYESYGAEFTYLQEYEYDLFYDERGKPYAANARTLGKPREDVRVELPPFKGRAGDCVTKSDYEDWKAACGGEN